MNDLVIAKTIVLSFCNFAAEKGVSLKSWRDPRLDEYLKNDQIEMIPFEVYAHFYEYVLTKVKDDLMGLHEGERFNMTALGVVGQLIQVSRNVEEALVSCCHYFNLVSNVMQLKLTKQNNEVRLTFEVVPEAIQAYPEAIKHFVLSSLAFSLKELHYLTLNRKAFPIQVEVSYALNDIEELERVFGSTIVSNAPANVISFDEDVLNQKIISADYDLMLILSEVACSKLNTFQNENNRLSDLVTQTVYRLLDPKLPDLRAVSQNLNMSERSLQRKLRQEGTSYSKLTETIKKKLVLDYLKQDLTVKEVSFLMGYSDPTAFVAAFKKWYGDTPGKFIRNDVLN